MSGPSVRFLDEQLTREKEYWLQKLSGELVITGIPLDHRRPIVPVDERAVADIGLDADIDRRFRRLCGQSDPLVYTVLVTVLKICLHKYTGVEDIIVGTTIESRYRDLASLNKVVALRNRVSGSLTIKTLLENVRQSISEAYANQKYSFKRLLELLNVEIPGNRAPLFNVAIVLDSIHDVENIRDLRNDLTLRFSKSAGSLSGVVEFNPGLFKRDSIQAFAEHYREVLRTVLDSPDITISEIGLLSPDRRRERIVGFNSTEVSYPKDRSINSLFEEQVSRTPGDVAVVLGASTLTYQELNSRANQLAHYLRGRGIGRGKLVGVFLDHSIEMVAGILGILKAGGAYVPFDSAHPRARLAFMLEDAGISLVLTQQKLTDRLPSFDGETLCLDSDWEVVKQESEEEIDGETSPDDLAYIIYTSGSTGKPKGVKIQHRSLVNYICWARDVYVRGETVAFPLYSSPAFDLTVTSIFTPLITGNRIVVYYWEGRDPRLDDIINDGQVDIIKLTPSHLSLIKDLDNRQSSIRRLIVGGEALETALAREVCESFGEGLEIFNEYGPTEATVGCMIHLFNEARDDRTFVPIGTPAANTQIYVLDRDMQPVAENVLGEIYIAGDGVAEGYLNREHLSVERFIENPFIPGGRMYRTGDIARWLPSGVLEYLGRKDDQVKFHGYRVEMNEIRSALNLHPQVRDSVVLLTKDGHGYDVMVAYYVSRLELDAGELRSFMAESIIEETLPNFFIRIARLPLTLNGKVNYAALPDLETARRRIKRDYAPPTNPTETVLAGIWADVLRTEQVGIHDNFFDLGGHSLLATQIISRVREAFQVEMPLRSVFETPTVASFAEQLEAASTRNLPLTAPTITRAPRDKALPLSFAQQRLWFIDQMEPGNRAYNIALAISLTGELKRDALQRSINELVRRHEALRTRFVVKGHEPVQEIIPSLEVRVEELALEALSPEFREAEAQAILRSEADAVFDLSAGPLLRFKLLRMGEQEFQLVVAMHHIVSDGWSMGVMVRELMSLYAGYSNGEEVALPDLPIQYADYAAWQREWLQGEVLSQQLDYWKGQLADLPALELPTDFARPEIASHNGGSVTFQLSSDLSDGLNQLSRREGATLFMTLLACWQEVLHRYSGQSDVAVGTAVANRNRLEIEGLIGFFVNTLVLRGDLSGDPSFLELLARVRKTTLDAYRHEELPFEKLVEELQPQRELNRAPLFQVMMVLQNAERQEMRLPGLSLTRSLSLYDSAKFDLTLTFSESPDGLSGEISYARDLFERGTIERLIQSLELLLKGVVADPARRVSAHCLLGDEERRRIISEWNDTDADVPDTSIFRMFEHQSDFRPDAVAVSFEDHCVTYGELNARSNRLAHYLRSVGAGPEVLIGLLAERGVEMVVGLLGVLKSGAAYLPVDPAYPKERLEYMLSDAEVTILLTQEKLLRVLPAYQGRVFALDGDWNQIATCSAENPGIGVDPNNLVYAIYTSGSTGQPKGAMNTHSGIVNRIWWMHQRYELQAGEAVLQKTPFTFDVSVWEFFWPLMIGGRLVMARPEGHRDSEYLVRLMQEKQISTVHFVPSMLEMFLNEPGIEKCLNLRRVICSGEALSAGLKSRFCQRSKAELHNLYGPTEAAVDVTSWECRKDEDGTSVPIGKPIFNTKLYVLDEQMNPAPIGAAGELYIGGSGVARGYLNRAALTGERFVPNPLANPGGRLYRTGDQVTWRADGVLEFLGRKDQQVKIRGYRIELGEIEAAILSHPGVAHAAVIVQDRGAGEKRLVAYIVKKASVGLDVAELKTHLAQLLPDYMAPAFYVELDGLPLTTSGKLDRKSLPAPEKIEMTRRDPYAPPTSSEEFRLAEIWQQVLGLNRVGIHDNFFDLGGHSLLLLQLRTRLRESFDKEVSFIDLFKYPSISALAGFFNKPQESAASRHNATRARAKRRADSIRNLRNPLASRGVTNEQITDN